MTPTQRLSGIFLEAGIALIAHGTKTLITELVRNSDIQELRDTIQDIRKEDIADTVRDIVRSVTK